MKHILVGLGTGVVAAAVMPITLYFASAGAMIEIKYTPWKCALAGVVGFFFGYSVSTDTFEYNEEDYNRRHAINRRNHEESWERSRRIHEEWSKQNKRAMGMVCP